MADTSKILVIAEKPSVASDIAKALGGFKRDGDFWVNDTMMIGAAVGHLLEIAAPASEDVGKGRWTFKNLPVIPSYFELKPITKTKPKLDSLLKAIKSRAVTEIINACDAGREGELIFRFVIQASKTKKPVRRLWLQSMTQKAIREGFQHLRTDDEMRPLEAAARARSEADWLIGINATRAMTAFNNLDGGFYLTTVGRVQTPTLSLVVSRENEIRAFVPRDYWEVKATFKVSEGTYEGTWVDPNFKKNKDDPHLKPERLWDAASAQAIAKAVHAHGIGEIEETSKRTRQFSPALFDLTSLQREANSRFGFSAKTTLSIAQALYEKHKAITYPRTDSRALPEDYLGTCQQILVDVSTEPAYQVYADKIKTHGWVTQDKRIFDNSQISDHFAIIPTGQMPKSLTDVEEKIYDLIVRRFLSVFYPAAEYDVTTRITKVLEHHFKTEGKVLVSPGWLEPAGRRTGSHKDALVPIEINKKCVVQEAHAQGEQTRPPARYTEATLLGAMETAGKKIDDDELRDAMAEKGLGTPATRAATIEGLIDQKYMRREERDLVPTLKAFQLMTLLKGLKIEALCEPRLTAEWEHQLRLIEENKADVGVFMDGIRQLTQGIVDAAKQHSGDTVPMEHPVHLHSPCPVCGGEVVENYRTYACVAGCGFSINKHPSSRVFEPQEVETLISTGRVGPLSGFLSRRGFAFEAELMLQKDEEGKLKMVFDFGEPEPQEEPNEDDIQDAPVMGTCPKCGSKVIDFNGAYRCEQQVKSGCDFRIAKTILQREMTPHDVTVLLAEGKTELLSGFISNRTKRPFQAHLVITPKKDIGFEFAKREEGETKKRAPRKSTKA